MVVHDLRKQMTHVKLFLMTDTRSDLEMSTIFDGGLLSMNIGVSLLKKERSRSGFWRCVRRYLLPSNFMLLAYYYDNRTSQVS